MMPNEDGIGPFVPKPTIEAPPKTRDLSSGLVAHNTEYTADSISAQAQPWRTAIDQAAQALKPDVDAVSGTRSELTQHMGASGADMAEGLITGNYGKAMSGLNNALNAPFTSLGSFVQSSQVNNAIKDFTSHNGDMLHDMNTSMALAEKGMNQISDLANNFTATGAKARALMDQKRSLGDEMMAKIDDAIANNDDPDTDAKLQAMKDDWSNWLNSRDQRVAAEQPEVNQLDAQAATMRQQSSIDGSTFGNAANMASKLIDSGGWDPTTAYTQHITPQATRFAQQLQQALVYSRAQFESTLK